MLDKKDAAWWIQEIQQHPDAAPDLVRALAERLAFLDKQNEELRAELITLRRQRVTASGTTSAESAAFIQRIQELETALTGTGAERRLVVYGRAQIEANQPLTAMREQGLKRTLPLQLSLLLTKPGAALLIVTEDARAFSVTSGNLPVPADGPAPLGNPNNVATILDPASAEGCRFLTLLTSRGYVYSLLLGTVMQNAKRGDKLLRNLVPDDPLVSVIASHNADLFALTEKGRWTRFPEKSVTGVGNAVMELPKGDRVVAVTSLPSEATLCILTTEGKVFTRDSAVFPVKRASGGTGGVMLKGHTVGGLTARNEVLILTRRGHLIQFKVKDLPFRAQSEAGTPIPDLAADDAFLTFTGL